MTEKQKKFLSIIQYINFPIYEGIYSGEIEKICINKSTMVLEMFIAFSEFVAPAVVNELIDTLRKQLVDKGLAKRAEVTINFKCKELPNHLLEQYYKYFLEVLCKSKVRYETLKKFETNFVDNKVTVMVANDFDREIALDLLRTIKLCFERFGFNTVNVDASINQFIMPISEEIARDKKAAEEQVNYDQRRYEESLNKNNQAEKPQSKKMVKMPKQGTPLNNVSQPLADLPSSEYELVEYLQKNGTNNFVIEGDIIKAEIKSLSTGSKIYEATMTDGISSIIIKTFINPQDEKQEKFYRENGMVGCRLKTYGYLGYDTFSRDIVLKIRESGGLGKSEKKVKEDIAPVKRVELHAHTKMSAQDSILDVKDYVLRAKEYGHTAVAVTDKYNVQALPDLQKICNDNGIKPIFGVEGALVDEAKFRIALTDADINLDEATYVVYDLETTGISSNYNEIIEIAACKIRHEMIIDEFSTYVNPKRLITDFTTSLTSITNDDLRGAPFIETAIKDFLEFFDGCILVAHNATFDNSHLYRNLKDLGLYKGPIPTIDTLQLARVCYGDKLKRFNLKALTKFFDVELEQHHRAIYDAKATAGVFLKMLSHLKNRGIHNYNRINSVIVDEEAYQFAFPSHITLLAKNRTGLVNINRIVSQSHTVNFSHEPRMLKKFLEEHRECILFGSSCYRGEVFEKAMNNSYEDLLDCVDFYDYLEVQPPEVYSHFIESSGGEITEEHIKEIIRKIISAGKEKGKIVVATGDVHHLEPEDTEYRKMLFEVPMVGGGMHDLHEIKKLPKQHFRTTTEMLDEFSFLGDELAYEIVVKNSNIISDMVEKFSLFPKELLAPSDSFMADEGIPSAKEAAIKLTYDTAHKKYGENLPKLVEDRLEKELNSIINNNYGSIYFIAHMLVKHSREAGYVVGSRGSVGSSLVANFMGITEVNSLSPHYVCPKCHFTAFKLSPEEKRKYGQTPEQEKFEEILQSYGTGFDMPKQKCPICGEDLLSDGCEIPFETFLGFSGNKVPDIDLNFSGEYQERAHNFCREIFGEDYTFRAGTISGIAEATAYGYVKGHYEREKKQIRNCEIDREAEKLVGVKRTTGQHPGGIVVVPRGIDINEITPVQYPADDTTLSWKTTHQTYHPFEANLLKLDILGHDDPTMIRQLMNYVEAEPEKFPFSKVEDIPLDDKDVLKMFSGVEILGVKPEDVLEDIGTTGLPEFGTTLAKDMLKEIRPTTVSDLIKISGLSHGEGIWNGNMRELFLGMNPNVKNLKFNELIGCRDDIMAYLLSKDLPAIDAFTIMEGVRKGKGLKKEQEKEMIDYGVPKWYIDACKAIKYMFPKAHATAYVVMALRIGWFKLHRPLYYYAGFFSKRADAFEIETMVAGKDAIKARLKELDEAKKLTPKEQKVYVSLLLSLEMISRGFNFKQIDIFKSDWENFVIDGDSLIIPFSAMDSLGPSIAKSIVDARNDNPFTSKKDVVRRSRINNTLVEKFNRLGIFKDLPEDDQLGLFNNRLF